MDPVTLNALTRRWQLDELGLDQEANTARINYRRSRSDLRTTKKRTESAAAANMADRGLARSGVAVGESLKRQEDYNRTQSLAGQQKDLAIANIIRKRALAKSAYDQARAQMLVGSKVAPIPTVPVAPPE